MSSMIRPSPANVRPQPRVRTETTGGIESILFRGGRIMECARVGLIADDRRDLTTASAITRAWADYYKSVAHRAAEGGARCGVRRRGQGTMSGAGWTQERSRQMTATP
jgi:hypothetical protein